MQCEGEACNPGRFLHSQVVAENKLASVSFRVQPAFKARFEEAFDKQNEYSSSTAFFEDCMRALMNATRRGERISLPLEIVTDKPDPAHGAD